MEYEKDKKDIIKDKSVSEHGFSKSLLLSNDFNDSLKNERVIKKTEKIIAAVYLVSGLIPESDPLRVSLRNEALSFLSFIIDGADSFRGLPSQQVVQTTILKVSSLTSLIEIAYIAGHVSEMNKMILVKELNWFVSEIAEKGNLITSGIVLKNDFFTETAPPVAVPTFVRQETKSLSKIASKTKQGVSRSTKQTRISGVKDDRRARLIDVVKKHGPLTIKDIASRMTDCSEKTIQRELVLLIKDKIIARQGERRWSVYSAV